MLQVYQSTFHDIFMCWFYPSTVAVYPAGPAMTNISIGTRLHAIHAFPNATFDVSDLQPWLDMAWRRKNHGTSHETQKHAPSIDIIHAGWLLGGVVEITNEYNHGHKSYKLGYTPFDYGYIRV